jgi:hypothetical protein
MKKLLCILLLVSYFTAQALDFSGVYQCANASDQDAKTTTITLKLNPAYNKPNSAYATYDFTMKAEGYNYSWIGSAVAHGANLAISFESTGPKAEKSDKGVSIATIITEQESNDKGIVRFHPFFYEKAYKGKPDYWFENCKLTQ